MEAYDSVLKKLERQYSKPFLAEQGVICKRLKFGDDVDPLYLAKAHWTNRFDEKRESTIGIFCAIWVTPALVAKNQFAYNIHSKAIRKLPGYQLASIPFARDFRQRVSSKVADWPDISLDHGPTTLLQGSDSSDLDDFAQRVEDRILGFVDIATDIDELLEETKS